MKLTVSDAAIEAGVDPRAVISEVVAGRLVADIVPGSGYRLTADDVRQHFKEPSVYDRLTSDEIDRLRRFVASPLARQVASAILVGEAPAAIRAKLDEAAARHEELIAGLRAFSAG